jgi:acyl dehydratase
VSLGALKVGETFSARVVDNLSRTQIVQYAGASGDYNPLHSDEVYAMQVAGYRSSFAHGMLTMGLTGKVLTDVFGADRIARFGVRFIDQVWPGDTLNVTATVVELRQDGGCSVADLDLKTVNQDGVEVMSGSATVRLDSPSDAG